MAERSPRLTYDEVARACFDILSTGQKLTFAAIYEAVGHRGSKSTILAFKDRYLSEMREKRIAVVPSSIPESMQKLFEDFYFRALDEASKAFDAQRQEYLEKISQAEGRERELDQKCQHLSAKNEELAEASVQAKSELGSVREQLENTRTELAQLNAQMSVAEERHGEELAAIKQAHELEVRDFQREIEAYRIQAEEARERLRSEYRRSENELDHWLIQIANERDNRKNAEERANATVSRYEAELNIARARENRLVQRAEAAESKVEALQEELDKLRGEGAHED